MQQSNTLRRGLSGTAFKRIACAAMFIDHFSYGFLYYLLSVSPVRLTLTPERFNGLAFLATAMRKVGRFAFPIYAFMLIEGFLHTSSRARYARRMLLLALVSEVPFDWGLFHNPFYWGHQNIFWTLFLGLIALSYLERFEAMISSGAPNAREALLCCAGVLFCVMAAELGRTDYGGMGILLFISLYLLRGQKLPQCLAAAAITLSEFPASLAFPPLVFFYNGERGRCAAWEKYAFYFFYPIHLIGIGILTALLLM